MGGSAQCTLLGGWAVERLAAAGAVMGGPRAKAPYGLLWELVAVRVLE